MSVPAVVAPVPALVTVHLFDVPTRAVPASLARMGWQRPLLRRTRGVTFGKLLGTGDGRTFTARDATPHRWGLLACWSSLAAAEDFEAGRLLRSWRRDATSELRLGLHPLTSRGRWSGRTPFGDPVPVRHDGPVAAITRARLTLRTAATFWQAVPPVSADLHAGGGVRLAVGIGEAPVGLQGTLSLWESATALREFAHRRPAHVEAIRRTAQEQWYAEELFARFAVESATGTLDGRDPLAGLRPGQQ